jgi:hypothetical protein
LSDSHAARKVVLTMATRKFRLDYPMLQDLARSRGIKVIEAKGLDTRRGVRFCRNGTEWLAVDASLPVEEKIRTLGFLLENERADMAGKAGLQTGFPMGSGMSHVLTLCCQRS